MHPPYIARCDRHIGDPVYPKCNACRELSDEWGQIPYSNCPIHPAHRRPCTRCGDA